MRIPHDMLKPDTLRRVIEEFVTRDGTDYGEREFTLEEKVEHVRRQLESGDVVIVFDSALHTCNLTPAK